MNNFTVLLTGELQRLKKYNILGASLLVSVIWIGFMHFTNIQDVSGIFPFLVFVDATAMSMLMIGVTMFFEKQEGTIKSLLVSPIDKGEYILAKTCANIISTLESLLIMYLYARIFKEIHINLFALVGAAVLIAFFHSLIGFWMTCYSRGFTDLLIGMLKYSFLLIIPVFFEQIGIIKGELIDKLLFILPTKPALILLNASTGGIESWRIWLSIGYLVVTSGVLYFIVSKKFDEFSIKESGV